MLERFGFTPTETKSYQALLKLGPSTGYAVARELGIARANVYQALESLVRRGAARKAATIPSRYSAAAPAALLTELERAFRRDLLSLDESLQRLPQSPEPAGHAVLESLTSAEQLLARAGHLVEAARGEVLAVSGPWAADLALALDRAQQRGVTVKSVALGEPAPRGAVIRAVAESDLRAYWGGLPIAVAADRDRAVFGVLTTGDAASGMATSAPGVVPFLRHLLRRELAGGA